MFGGLDAEHQAESLLGSQDELDTSDEENFDLDVNQTWKDYIKEKKFDQNADFISYSEYAKIHFMNDVPEIVCDIVYYLARYVYYRHSDFTCDSY